MPIQSFQKQIYFNQQTFILNNATAPWPWEAVFIYYVILICFI